MFLLMANLSSSIIVAHFTKKKKYINKLLLLGTWLHAQFHEMFGFMNQNIICMLDIYQNEKQFHDT